MTACVGASCGTGLYAPVVVSDGDPDNGSLLFATPAFGGIDVTWTYPSINPEAVAHVRVLRSSINDYATTVLAGIASGNFFYDRQDNSTVWYYWIEIVSLSGSVGAPIGPASAQARPLIAEMIERLSGQILKSSLATELSSDIARIGTNYDEFIQEIANRKASDDTITLALTDTQNKADQTAALVQQEVTARTDGDSVLANQINTVAVAADDKIVSAETRLQTSIDLVDGKAVALQAQYTVKLNANNHIAGFGLANTPSGDDGTNTSQFLIMADRFAVSHPSNRWAASTAYGLGTFAHPTSSAKATGLIYEATTAGTSAATEPVWPATVGMTVTDGTVVWAARSATSRVPFIVDNGVVYISEAAINKLTFSKLRDEQGTFIVENGRIKANYLRVQTASIDDAAITTAKIGDAQISTAKIGDAQITNAKIGNLAVDTLKIAGNAVTIPVSAYTSGSVQVVNTLTVQSVAIASSGAPIAVMASVQISQSAVEAGTESRLRILRNGSILYEAYVATGAGIVAVMISDTPGAGTHTYDISIVRGSYDTYAANRSLLLLETKR